MSAERKSTETRRQGTNLGFDAERLNHLLEVAMGAATLRAILPPSGGMPEQSALVSGLFGTDVYIQAGPETYGGSIKAQAAWGFFGDLLFKKIQELQEKEKDDEGYINARKSAFFKDHGIEKPNGLKAHLGIEYLAAWEAFKDINMICPSSGSFAFGFGEVLKQLREVSIPLPEGHTVKDRNGETITKLNLLQPSQGKVTPFIPDITRTYEDDEVISLEKLRIITKTFRELGCEPVSWTDAKTRDYNAFVHALNAEGGVFCATNPMSEFQVIEVARRATIELGFAHMRSRKENLDRMGIRVSVDGEGRPEVTARPVDQGIGGLLLAKLDGIESLLKSETYQHDSYHQPSSGATLAAAATGAMLLKHPDAISTSNRALLEKFFPGIYNKLYVSRDAALNFNVYGCYDPGNPALANVLGYVGSPTRQPGVPIAVNGLASFSTSQESEMLLAEAKREKVLQGMIPCGHAAMELARVVMLAHNVDVRGEYARFPESAGAAGLGGLIQNKIDNLPEGEVAKYAKTLALTLRNNGVTIESLNKLLWDGHKHPVDETVGVERFITESQSYSEITKIRNMDLFSTEFSRAMKVRYQALKSNVEAQPVSISSGNSPILVMNTGSNCEQHRDVIASISSARRTNGELAAPAVNQIDEWKQDNAVKQTTFRDLVKGKERSRTEGPERTQSHVSQLSQQQGGCYCVIS